MGLISSPHVDTDIKHPVWRQAIINLLNLKARGQGQAPVAVTPTGSPYQYYNANNYALDMIVQGGTVSLIEFSRDKTTYYAVGFTSGIVRLSQQDYLRVTYTVAPTMTAIPR